MEAMNRRSFIKGTVAAAVAAALPGGDGVALYSAAHPVYTHKTYATSTVPRDLGCQMARALAKSMMQTREVTGANVLNKAFS